MNHKKYKENIKIPLTFWKETKQCSQYDAKTIVYFVTVSIRKENVFTSRCPLKLKDLKALQYNSYKVTSFAFNRNS